MNAWQELVKMALLGTEKMPLQTTILPQNIQNILEKADKADKEAYFLKAAALTLTYWKAGQITEKTPLPDIVVAPDETKAFPPPQYITILKRLFDEGTSKFPSLVVLLFEKIKQKDFVLPHESICSVLKLTEEGIFRPHKTLISSIVGERGRWLQQFNDKWQLPKDVDFDTIWAEGSSAERRASLVDLRRIDQNRAFLLIKETWETANARERKDLLKILSIDAQPEEGIFVQTIYNELLDAKATTKAINQDIKELAVAILLSNPASELYKSVVERLKKYVSTKKKFLGLQSKTVLELPTEEDDFLNKEVMKTEFALTTTPSTNEYLTEYWFCYFLQNLHPTAWETLLNTDDWQHIFDILFEADKFISGGRKTQQRFSFRKYASMGLAKAQYRKGISVYLEKLKLDESNIAILNILTNEELETFFIKNIDVGKANSLRNALIRNNWRWSSALSRYVLRSLVAETQSVYYNAQFALNVAIHFDESILKELNQLVKQEETDWHKQQIRNTLVVPLIQFLELRKEIENLV